MAVQAGSLKFTKALTNLINELSYSGQSPIATIKGEVTQASDDFIRGATELYHCVIQDASCNPDFLRDPERDFTRNRALPFSDVFLFITMLTSRSLDPELISYFGISNLPPHSSAFCHARNKIRPEAFEWACRQFTELLYEQYPMLTFKGYRLLACDGSLLNLLRNPDDVDSYIEKKGKNGYNQFRLVAIRDILNGPFVDWQLKSFHKINERDAFIEMIDAAPEKYRNAIITMDRGFESFNLLGHLHHEDIAYVLRVKGTESNGILAGLGLPSNTAFDKDICLSLSRKPTAQELGEDIFQKLLCGNTKFDFINKENLTYKLKIRIIALEISDGVYEYIITNLPRDVFPSDVIFALYKSRWCVEVGFRQYKWCIGSVYLHSRKKENLLQEIYGRLMMFNYTSAILNRVEQHYLYTVAAYVPPTEKLQPDNLSSFFTAEFANQINVRQAAFKGLTQITGNEAPESSSGTGQAVSFTTDVPSDAATTATTESGSSDSSAAQSVSSTNVPSDASLGTINAFDSDKGKLPESINEIIERGFTRLNPANNDIMRDMADIINDIADCIDSRVNVIFNKTVDIFDVVRSIIDRLNSVCSIHIHSIPEVVIKFSTSTTICREFLKHGVGKQPTRLIARYVCSSKSGRSFKRNVKPQSAKSQNYRVS